MSEIFEAYLKNKAGLSDEELELVRENVIPRRLRKRQYLLQEGDICNFHCFVSKGCLRSYRVSEDGTEHILRFAVEEWWLTDQESFNSGKPSKNNIDALEDSEVILVEKDKLPFLINNLPKLQIFKEQLIARTLDASQNRILSNIMETAEERYEHFMSSHRQIFNRVPLHMVASYLGVSRETLSRIRNQYTRTH